MEALVCGRPLVGKPASDRVGGSLVRYSRMSGLLMQPSLAAGRMVFVKIP